METRQILIMVFRASKVVGLTHKKTCSNLHYFGAGQKTKNTVR